MTTLSLFDDPTSGAVLSDDRVYRYFLERKLYDYPLDRLELSGWLGFIMLNPSTADEIRGDTTISKCKGFAERLGYSGIRVANLYGYRTAYPTELAAAEKCGIDIIGPDNERWIRHVLANCQKVVVAWGMQGPRRERIGRLVALANEMKVPLYAIGVNKDGSPKHPSRTPYATPMTEWRMAA